MTEAQKNVRISLPTDAMKRVKSVSGGVSYHCGDKVAENLNGLPLEHVKSIAASMGLEHSKYGHLNVGQQRMNIGNLIRTKVRKSEDDAAMFLDVVSGVREAFDKETEAEREAKAKADAEKKEAAAAAKAEREAAKKAKADEREAKKADAERLKGEKAAAKEAKQAEREAAKKEAADARAQNKADREAAAEAKKAEKAKQDERKRWQKKAE